MEGFKEHALLPKDRMLVRPVIDVARYNAFPPAARKREIIKAANTFASSGKTVFVHHTTDVLSVRRAQLLQSGSTKKRFHKSAAQLWQTLEQEQYEEFGFWHQVARELRIAMSVGTLTHEDCLKYGGRPGDANECVWHAEVAVSFYLGTAPPLPLTPAECEPREVSGEYDSARVEKPTEKREKTAQAEIASVTFATEGLEKLQMQTVCADTVIAAGAAATLTAGEADVSASPPELLDTLPDAFDYTPNMLYSHFAHYDLNDVRKAEGKHQTAMLRQLADLLDKTGKELFYYYAVPRLCKACFPPRDGSTVTSIAADVWRMMTGPSKEHWTTASWTLKKQLGDGDVMGLKVLQLDSLDPEVLRVHALVQEAVEKHAERKKM